MRLPAPIIEGTLPAFYTDDRGTATIAVPFSISRAVNKSQIQGFEIKIRPVYGSAILLTLSATTADWDEANNIINFKINNIKDKNFYEGNFYKVQLAFVNNNDVGYYSTVGVIKYTTKPTVKIDDLKIGNNNTHLFEYTGVYSQFQKDITEKEYSYRFIVKEEITEEVIEDTGFLIHDNSQDLSQYESSDIFYLSKSLVKGKKYNITYIIRTNNNLEIKSPSYRILLKQSIPPNLNAYFSTTLNYENGYVNLILNKQEEESDNTIVKGTFLLTRSSEDSNYTDWEEVSRFNLASRKRELKSWKDFAVEQGKKYQYSLQQFNDQGLYSERILSDIIYVDFEHSFLYDGERQLKIKYNPKVSSFKTDILEAKIDTIGSKYPFIFRNGNVEYKEFPINGLISYLMDEESLFINNSEKFESPSTPYEDKFLTKGIKLSQKEIDYIKKNNLESRYYIIKDKDYYQMKDTDEFDTITTYYYKSRVYDREKYKDVKFANTNLESDNITTEREFKLEVLNWLNNGKPKLFKSPNEGNYLVRLMNISLSPEDQVGRMLHNFSAMAYEIGEPSYENLASVGLVNQSFERETYYKLMSIPLSTTDKNYYLLHKDKYIHLNGVYYAQGEILTHTPILNLSLNDLKPGAKIYIDDAPVVIGSTGAYEIPFEVNSVYIPEETITDGFLTIGYYSQASNPFDEISDTETKEIIAKQYIGYNKNLKETVENVEKSISSVYNVKSYKRPVRDVIFIPEDYVDVSEQVAKEVNTWRTIWELQGFTQEEIGLFVNELTADYYQSLKIGSGDEDWSWPPHPTNIYLDSNARYYEKKKYIQSINGENLIEYEEYPDSFTECSWFYEDRLNELESLRFTYSESEIGPLYYEVYFKNIDKLGHSVDDQCLDWQNRVATNPALFSFEEYDLFVKAKKLYRKNNKNFVLVESEEPFNSKEHYFLNKEITFYIIPELELELFGWLTGKHNPALIKYISEEDYNLFSLIKTKEQMDQAFGENKEFVYSSSIYYNGEKIDLEETEYHSSGEISKDFNYLTTNVGVYCEVYCQAQIKEYNEKSLQEFDFEAYEDTKLKLDKYNEILSREYRNQMYETGKEEEYLNELFSADFNYAETYEGYINLLNRFTESLEMGD